MRKSVIALVAGLLLLVGCATTISGSAASDPKAGQAASSRALTTPNGSLSSTSASSAGSSSSTTGRTTSSATRTSATTSSTSSTSSTTSTAATGSTGDVPDGFSHWSAGLAYRYLDTSEYDCSAEQVNGCAGVEVFSAAGCPAGVTVIMDIFDEADANLGTMAGTSDPLEARATVKVIVGGDITSADATSASIKDLTC